MSLKIEKVRRIGDFIKTDPSFITRFDSIKVNGIVEKEYICEMCSCVIKEDIEKHFNKCVLKIK